MWFYKRNECFYEYLEEDFSIHTRKFRTWSNQVEIKLAKNMLIASVTKICIWNMKTQHESYKKKKIYHLPTKNIIIYNSSQNCLFSDVS